MTETKHTPGPWVRDCWDILGNDGKDGTGHVCEISRPNSGDEFYWREGEADANARLIAAAPDMLEALKYAYNYLGGFGLEGEPGCKRIIAVINKAEGRE